MDKYYIDDVPFAYDDKRKWEWIVTYIEGRANYIEVIDDLFCESDKVSREKIQDLLNKEVDYFKCQQPFERSVSLSPFLKKNEYNSVCFKYKIDSDLVKELESDWQEALAFEFVIPQIVAYIGDVPTLMVTALGTIAYLAPGQVPMLKNSGFNFEEYRILLNDAAYKLISL